MRCARRTVAAALLASGIVAAFGGTALSSVGVRFGAEGAAMRVTFSALRFEGGFGTNECPVTLSGTLAGATRKTTGWLTGEVGSATVGTCIRGSFGLPTEALPWRMRYVSFQGVLPNITGVRLDLREVAVLITPFGANCVYRGAGTATLNGPTSTQLTLGGTLSLASGAFCSPSGTLSGTGMLATRLELALVAEAGSGITAADVTFADTTAGRSTRQACNINNDTDFRASIASVSISGDRVFSVEPSSFVVQSNSNSDIWVTFRPTERRAFSATLNFLDLEGRVLFSSRVTGRGT